MIKILKQFLAFIGISGLGWIIDFSVYCLLSICFEVPVGVANIISAIPAVSFVFVASTRKNFVNENAKIALRYKYLIYVAEQIVQVCLVSLLTQVVFNGLQSVSFIENVISVAQLKVLVKIGLTPITMTINFIFMKFLIERI